MTRPGGLEQHRDAPRGARPSVPFTEVLIVTSERLPSFSDDFAVCSVQSLLQVKPSRLEPMIMGIGIVTCMITKDAMNHVRARKVR